MSGKLARQLGIVEAIGLSLSIIAPTMAMAFNVTLAAQSAGRAAPLAFAVGTVALAVVGLSFVSFARRVASAGSAFAYIAASFGGRAGFVAGWLLLLTYLTYGTGTAALVGNFVAAALANYGVAVPGLWVVVAALAVLLAILLAYRDMRLAARLMLALEGLSVLAILVLVAAILAGLGRAGALSAAPFHPAPEFGGWSGVGFGMVFAVLSFAGFEGAATLGEETRDPRRAIPVAVLGTVLLAGVFYVLVAYAEVMGFGLDHVKELGSADSPLNLLAARFVSRDFGTLINLAAAISAFSCVLGCLAAAARMLFALSRAGLAPRLAGVHPAHGTPAPAVLLAGIVILAGIVVWAPRVGASDYYGYQGTIGTLALILVYLGVTLAEAAHAARARRAVWCLCGALGALLLLWPLGNSLYPVPAWPYDLFPYAVLGWIVLGIVVLALRPVRLDAEADALAR
jgi:amino acid transporter